MRTLHVKSYQIERTGDGVIVKLGSLQVAAWTPLTGLYCSNEETKVDQVKLAQACAEEWVRPTNAIREPVSTGSVLTARKPRSWDESCES